MFREVVRAGSCDTRVKHHNPVFIGRKTVLKMTRSLGQNTAVITFGKVIYTAKQEISNGNVQTSSQIIRIPYGTDFFFAAISKLYESMKGVA